MPVLPAVASTMVPPGLSWPSASALRIIPIAALSFTLPPGFRYSSLAKTSAAFSGTMRRSRKTGVWPTNSVIFSATRNPVIANFLDYGRDRRTVKRMSKNKSGCRETAPQNKLKLRNTLAVGRLLFVSKVTFTGPDLQFFVAWCASFHLYVTIAAIAAGVCGPIGDAVLIADVLGYFLADFINFRQIFGKKRHAASLV